MAGRFTIEGILKPFERIFKIQEQVTRPVRYIKRVAAKVELRAIQREYCESGNPLFIFRAIELCHEHEFEYPEFVTTYLLESAELLLSVDHKDDTNNRTLKSLGFTGDNPNRSQFKKYQERMLEIEITLRAAELHEQGLKPTERNEEIRKEFGNRWHDLHGRIKPGPTDKTINRYLKKHDSRP